jgi:hypothetical protein
LCFPCLPGEFNDQEGKTSCKLCPINTKSEKAGLKECSNCGFGEKSDEEGSAKCVKCGAGEASTGIDGKCESCSEGRYRPSKNSDGTETDAASCFICPVGWSAEGGSSKCRECEVGRYNAIEGETCKDCWEGSYRSSKMGITCDKCKVGEESVNGSTRW